MKVLIDECEQYTELEIIIKCKKCDEDILSLLARIKSEDEKILGTIDEKTYVLQERDILYFESVDKKCFIYTKDKVYETPLKLYEIENMLRYKGFFRATKSSIVNIAKIKSIQSAFNSVLTLEMENNERLTVSRQYAPMLKEKLGTKNGGK